MNNIEARILADLKAGRVMTVKGCSYTTELRHYISIIAKKIYVHKDWQRKGKKRWMAYWMHS